MEKFQKKCYVAMLDIMGFKDMVKHENCGQVYDLLNKISEQIRDIKKFYNLDIMMFSDTILIISENDTERCYEDIVIASAIFENEFVKNGYAINGAITCGNVIYDKNRNICFGEPIIEAHLLQEKLFFYGIVIPDYVCRADDSFLNREVVDIVVPLNVKFKCSDNVEGYETRQMNIVRWEEMWYQKNAPFEDQKDVMRKNIRKIFEKNIDKSKRVYDYISNTEDIFKQWFDWASEQNRMPPMKWGDLICKEYYDKFDQHVNNLCRK